MAKSISALVRLSTADLKKLLAARERIDVLEAEKSRLARELAAVDRELNALLGGGAAPERKPAKKAAGRKAAAKPAKKGAQKAAKKTAKKTTKKTAKKTAKKSARKAAPKAPAKAAGRVRLEDVIVAVLKKAGGRLAYQDLHATIVKGRLFPTKSTNFDNVLRRTLSTSGAVKRVGRGVYAVA